MKELEGKIEAILFASGDYVSLEKLITLTGESKTNILSALKSIQSKYTESAIQLQEQANTWKFGIKNPYMPVVQNLIQNTELTKSVMETLAVIAWKSPIVQAEVIKIRTNKAYDHIAELIEKGFVTKEKSGRTYALKLTQKFFDYFDVSSREQIQEIFSEVDSKPKNHNAIPQKKVIDYDGTPRPSAKLDDVKIEVYDAQAAKVAEDEKKKQDALHIRTMREQHKSHLDELDELLKKKAQENKMLVDEIHANIPAVLKEHQVNEQPDAQDPASPVALLNDPFVEVEQANKPLQATEPQTEQNVEEDEEILEEASGERSKRLEDQL